MTDDASSAASYAAATDNLRTTTRWLLTAAAAAGAVLVAGVQLTSIGSLSLSNWPRLMAAAVGLAAGLGAVGYMIFEAGQLLTDEWITLAELELEPFRQQLADSGSRDKWRLSRRDKWRLSLRKERRHSRRTERRLDEIDRISTRFQFYPDEFYGSVANSVPDLYSRFIEANEKARESPSPEHAQTATDLKRAVNTVLQAANYSYTRSGFEVLRKHLAQAGAVFVVGIVIFAYAANPPKPAARTAVTGHAAVQRSPAPKGTKNGRPRSTPQAYR